MKIATKMWFSKKNRTMTVGAAMIKVQRVKKKKCPPTRTKEIYHTARRIVN